MNNVNVAEQSPVSGVGHMQGEGVLKSTGGSEPAVSNLQATKQFDLDMQNT